MDIQRFIYSVNNDVMAKVEELNKMAEQARDAFFDRDLDYEERLNTISELNRKVHIEENNFRAQMKQDVAEQGLETTAEDDLQTQRNIEYFLLMSTHVLARINSLQTMLLTASVQGERKARREYYSKSTHGA